MTKMCVLCVSPFSRSASESSSDFLISALTESDARAISGARAFALIIHEKWKTAPARAEPDEC